MKRPNNGSAKMTDRQRCEVKARRDAKHVLQNYDCFGAKRMENME